MQRKTTASVSGLSARSVEIGLKIGGYMPTIAAADVTLQSVYNGSLWGMRKKQIDLAEELARAHGRNFGGTFVRCIALYNVTDARAQLNKKAGLQWPVASISKDCGDKKIISLLGKPVYEY